MGATYFFVLFTILALAISSRVVGVWFTPLSHYSLRWLLLVFLVELNLLGYDEISPLTWWVVFGSYLAFSLGALLPMLKSRSIFRRQGISHIQDGLRDSINPQKLLKAIFILFMLGTIIFLVFMYNVGTTLGLGNFLQNGQILRLAMNEGELPFGFHYLYIMEMVGPLCFLYFLLFKKKTPKWVFAAMVLSIASLFFTTARTNMTKSLVWILYILMFFQIEYLRIKRFSKIVAAMVGLALGMFFVIGIWTSETFGSTEIFKSGNYSGPGASLLMPYFYMSVELPVLDKILQDPNIQFEWGKYTFLPVFKVLKLFSPEMSVPSHIGQFYYTPLASNIATYLDLMYKDFGLIGPIILPFLIGAVSSYLFARMLFNRVGLALFMINTIMAMTIFASTSSANYMKASYWFQIFAILVISHYARARHSSTT